MENTLHLETSTEQDQVCITNNVIPHKLTKFL